MIDVRFRPQSRRPGMSKTRLGDMLGEHGIAYEHRKALGTPPDLRHDFHAGRIEQARAATARTSRRPRPTRSTQLAGELERGPRTALLCLEADPAGCHRRVVCEALRERAAGARGHRPLVVQQEPGGVEHAPLAQPVEPTIASRLGSQAATAAVSPSPRRPLRLGLVHRLAQPCEVVGARAAGGPPPLPSLPRVLAPAPLRHAGGAGEGDAERAPSSRAPANELQ